MTNKLLISKKISNRIKISHKESIKFFESFLFQIKINARSKLVKITNFGSYYSKETKQRIGRNPKTKESYIINKRNKIAFKASNAVRKKLN